MIAHLRGRLLAKHPQQAIIEAGGVGYEVLISVPTFSALPSEGTEVSLFIYTHVREDTLALYGFLDREQKRVFGRLITVSGVGPKAGRYHPERFEHRALGGRHSQPGSCDALADSRHRQTDG